ncbi:MAG: type I DNA topoisomerase [Rhodospirillales bacterium]|nr:type I DNA topoisomerase [Rhodospirillales bacterium]
MHVVVVESPAKARTLTGYLGEGHEVIATRGHVQDLAAKDGSVDPDRDFAMVYATRRGAARAMRAIAAALADADALVLATDPDREGEAIAWQVLEWLREKGALDGKAVRRVAFHEITPDAVQDAMARPRGIDMDLVRAQQARRALDYLVGFNLSALLWRKVRGGRSAGRVQSVALRLLCAREAEIEGFEPEEYWIVDAAVMAERGGSFTARLARLDGEELDRVWVGPEAAARAAERIGAGVFRVAALERGEVRRAPVPPFITSTLQQEASRRLGFGVRRTMRLAQALYEGVELDGEAAGLITYMRTDSAALSKGAATEARKVVRERFGADWLPAKARLFRSRVRNAQEAHEAIRPTVFSRTPESLARRIGGDAAELYALIWQRAVASQMAAARLNRARVELVSEGGDIVLEGTGSRIVFEGFLRVWREDSDEDDAGDGGALESERPLPEMAEGERVFVTEVRPERRFTRPPARYTEAGLVRRLEELGIGRPSTYASVVGVLRERGYAVLYRRRFVPTERGRVVTAFLETWFAPWVADGFTGEMEADLDRVAGGAVAGKAVLHGFWGDFEGALERAGGLKREEVRAAVERALEVWLFGPAGEPQTRSCPSCAEGRLELRFGRFGPFVGCARYPACRYTRPLARDPADDGAGPAVLGADPETGQTLTLRTGRYGRYVQLGEDAKDPRTARGTVPMGMEAHEITPEVARALLDLPRTVGEHPDTGKPILAGIGRYGPWLKHGAGYVPLPEDEDVLAIGLNRAVMLVDTG